MYSIAHKLHSEFAKLNAQLLCSVTYIIACNERAAHIYTIQGETVWILQTATVR